MKTTIETFETTQQKTQEWLQELTEIGEFRDERQAYSVLRGVLHALRDRLTIDEAAQFAAQLPMLVRGVYYEGWKPAAVPRKIRDREEFLDHVRREFRDDVDIEASSAVEAVFRLLGRRVTEGEIEDVKGILPAPIAKLWP